MYWFQIVSNVLIATAALLGNYFVFKYYSISRTKLVSMLYSSIAVVDSIGSITALLQVISFLLVEVGLKSLLESPELCSVKIYSSTGPILYGHSLYGLVLIHDKSSDHALGTIHNRADHCCYNLCYKRSCIEQIDSILFGI